MQPFMAKIMSNQPLGKDMRKLVLSAKQAIDEGICPGTFAHIKVPNAPQHLLRRPISIMDVDVSEKTITLAIMPKGNGTELICALKPNDELEIIAPLGKGFSADDAKNIWVMGGGVGIAPLLYACRRFSKTAQITAILGYRTEWHIYAQNDFSWLCKEMIICTDDGSCGIHGNVVDAARTLSDKPDLIMACGPTPMLKAVQSFALENKIPCQLSLEQKMGCGYGACLTCSCKTIDKNQNEDYARVCADGPVFDAAEVIL